MNLIKSLKLNSRRFPRKDAIVFEGNAISYKELYDRTVAFSEQLVEKGVRANDKVAIVSENHPNYFVAIYAITALGAIPALINYRLKPEDLKQVIINAECKAAVVGLDWEYLANDTPAGVDCFFSIEDESSISNESLLAMDGELTQTVADEIYKQAHSTIMFHTSGTTGLPKGVLRSKMGFEHRSVQYGVSAEDSFLAVMPCCLSAGGTYALWALYIGSTLHLHRNVDYSAILETIEKYRVSVMALLPPMLDQIFDLNLEAKRNIKSLKYVISGGGYIDESLRLRSKEILGDVLTVYYGSSELGPSAFLSAKELNTIYRDNCIGRPFFGADVILLDEKGNEVEVGETGRICVRSDMQLDSYYKNEELIKDISVGEYLCVGDLGRFDEDGLLYFVGRERDFIRTGGINVPSGDVESTLLNHPLISEVYCVGVPDKKWGEAICAVIIVKPNETLTNEDVVAFSAENLPGYKKPQHILFVDEVPKNLSGRVVKPELLKIVEEKLGGEEK
ncbi:long-chain-fatty-acid--CoA ligase FadD2 [Maricurvus nonylphenolicus]|uniref:class I adenylate-forming enzyme family protein n=1 Tax=Maricurvus nonylphenolicus TaxID=1008307 RepID=UPI0036F27982